MVAPTLVRPHAEPADTWQYAAADNGITDTTAVEIRAAQTGRRNYITSLQCHNKDATVGTEVIVKSGSTVIWRMHFQPGTPAALSGLVPFSAAFPVPLAGGTGEALTVECETTSSETYFNAQGYTAP